MLNKSLVYHFIFFTTVFFCFAIHGEIKKAIVCAPVADLLGQSAQSIYPDQSINDSYDNLPVCYERNTHYACPRVHQLVFNDIVDVIEIKNDEANIQISNVFYTTLSNQVPQTKYWTAAKNIRLLDDLASSSINIQHLPTPLSFDNQSTQQDNQCIITLMVPHHDPTIDITFSAGTRFVCAKKPTKKQKKIQVFVINHAQNREIKISIPTDKCFITKVITPNEQIAAFVHLLTLWSHQAENSFIPYVWGGTSFINTTTKPFTTVTKSYNNQTYSYFKFEDDNSCPKTGFDCSGVIARAAQICGMPYFYKNTTTIARHLQELLPGESVTNGDLILVKGHVMVVSDTQRNMLIEARSYGHGYGKLHEIALHDVFDGIETYDDLCKRFFEKKPLQRKDSSGTTRDTYTGWKLLKMISIYK